jgi:hypothetical protein
MDENATNGQQIPPKVDLRKQMPPKPAAVPPAADRMQTMQIDMGDLQAPTKVSGAAQAGAPPQRATVVVKPVSPAPVEAAGVAAEPRKSPTATVPVVPVGAPPTKRETSRIPLEMAKPPLGAAPPRPTVRSGAPSTIRVKPVVVRQTVDLAQAVPDQAAPAAAAPETPTAEPAAAPSPDAGKRKTSRISLEAVLGAPAPAAAPAQPAVPVGDDEQRTIRLRRTSEPLAKKTVSITDLGAEAVAPEPETTAGGEPSPTRKKTIKVRRPGEAGEGGAPAEVARPAPSMAMSVEQVEDRPNAVFGWFAGVGVAVCLVVIYVLMAQAFGPNICMTTVSYGWPEFDVSWPGKIAR